jgi:hypothetical protein
MAGPQIVVVRERQGCGWACGNVVISILLIVFGMVLMLFLMPGLFMN